MSSQSDITSNSKHVLFDAPVSNNGAKCRIILYKKGIPETEVGLMLPTAVGGMRDPKYLEMNPQGKMPVMVTSDGTFIPESDTIARFLMSEYAHLEPTFQPNNALSNKIARFNDIYLTTIQGCLYKQAPPFGIFGTRTDAIAEFRRQLCIIDNCLDIPSPYLCGSEISLADASLFPTMVFANYMLPKFDVPESEALPPKVKAWFDNMIQSDADFGKIYTEIRGALEKWDAGGRWDSIWLAGARDTDPPTIFDKIVSGEIPSVKVRETDRVIAFKDINPAAPAHVLVIPKERYGLSRLTKATGEHVELLGNLMLVAADVAKDTSLGFGDGARFVINDGPDGGQEVPHLHIHVIGGRKMVWPPS